MPTDNSPIPTADFAARILALENALHRFKTDFHPALSLQIDNRFNDRDDLTDRLAYAIRDTLARHRESTRDEIHDLRKKFEVQSNHTMQMRKTLEIALKDTISKLETRVHLLEAQTLAGAPNNDTQEQPDG